MNTICLILGSAGVEGRRRDSAKQSAAVVMFVSAYTILYYTILYYTIIYYTTPYYIL